MKVKELIKTIEDVPDYEIVLADWSGGRKQYPLLLDEDDLYIDDDEKTVGLGDSG